MPSAVITRKGQVTIPKTIRDELKLDIGDRVTFAIRDHEVVLRAEHGTILDLEGSVEPRQRPEDFKQVRHAVLRERAERAARRG